MIPRRLAALKAYRTRVQQATRPVQRYVVVFVSLLVASFVVPQACAGLTTTPLIYYVDCAGRDSNSGLDPNRAWQTLNKASRAALNPGDQLLFKRGCVWNRQMLTLSRSGTAAQPILISAYGTGNLPVIQNSQYNVLVRGANLIIEYIATRADVTQRDANCANQPFGYYTGFRLEAGASNNIIRYVHASEMTHGMKIKEGANNNRVLNSTFHNNNMMFLLNRDNLTDDGGANGVVIEGDDNEIAYNDFVGHDACSYDFTRDGSAVEIYGGRRNRMHHNTALDNNTFSELGLVRSADNLYAYNKVVAHIPYADFITTRGVGSIWGPVYGTRIFNNTVYMTDPTAIAVSCNENCRPEVLIMKNNIIWSEGIAVYASQQPDETNNLFWKSNGQPKVMFPTIEQMHPSNKIVNPQFVDLASGDFRLKANSPALNIGVAGSGLAFDFEGQQVPQNGGIDLGAYERVTTATTFALDQFNTVQATSWGRADTGGTYSLQGNADSFAKTGRAGTMLLWEAGSTRSAVLSSLNMLNLDSSFLLRTDKAATGDGQQSALLVRQQADGSGYRVIVRQASDGGVYLQATRTTGGIETALGSEVRVPTLDSVPERDMWVRVQVSGVYPTTIRSKVWSVGQPQPAWQMTATDPTAFLQRAGSAGLQAHLSPATTNQPVRFSFDEWRILNVLTP